MLALKIKWSCGWPRSVTRDTLTCKWMAYPVRKGTSMNINLENPRGSCSSSRFVSRRAHPVSPQVPHPNSIPPQEVCEQQLGGRPLQPWMSHSSPSSRFIAQEFQLQSAKLRGGLEMLADGSRISGEWPARGPTWPKVKDFEKSLRILRPRMGCARGFSPS